MKRREFLKAIFAIPIGVSLLSFRRREKEITVLETVVAGFQYYEGEKVWKSLSAGTRLTLKREPENPYDEMAVAVYSGSRKLGYLPRMDNTTTAQLMDSGSKAYAVITHTNRSDNPWERVSLKVRARV